MVKHSEKWRESVSKPRPQHVRDAISKAQKGRTHQAQEGFQKGHPAAPGTESTRFYKGQPSWNKGTGKGRDPILARYQTYKFNAKKRGLPFDLTKDEFRVFATSACHYCGAPAVGVDRINNVEGYVAGNMVACCEICNHMKWILPQETFLGKCQQIIANLSSHIS